MLVSNASGAPFPAQSNSTSLHCHAALPDTRCFKLEYTSCKAVQVLEIRPCPAHTFCTKAGVHVHTISHKEQQLWNCRSVHTAGCCTSRLLLWLPQGTDLSCLGIVLFALFYTLCEKQRSCVLSNCLMWFVMNLWHHCLTVTLRHRFATMEGVLALVRLYQRFTFTLNDQKHGGKPLEHESLITLMPKVQHKHACFSK